MDIPKLNFYLGLWHTDRNEQMVCGSQTMVEAPGIRPLKSSEKN